MIGLQIIREKVEILSISKFCPECGGCIDTSGTEWSCPYCGIGGDVFYMAMLKWGCSFADAINTLHAISQASGGNKTRGG